MLEVPELYRINSYSFDDQVFVPWPFGRAFDGGGCGGDLKRTSMILGF